MFQRPAGSTTSHDGLQYVRLRNLGASSSTAEAHDAQDTEDGPMTESYKLTRRRRLPRSKSVIFFSL